MRWSVVPQRLCSSGSGRTCDGVKLVLYYVEFVQAHATKTLTTDGGLIRGVGKCATSLATSFDASMRRGPEHLVATLYPDTVFFLLSPLVSEELLPHPLPLHGDHLHSLRKRDDYNPPPLPPPAFTGTQVKLCFFSSFFRFFSDHCRDLFSPHAGSSNPHLSTVPPPSSLASPAAAIASFAGT